MKYPSDKLTKEECIALGKKAKSQYDNMLIGAFAAELIGESYPFSPSVTERMLKDMSDENVGRKFARWMDEADAYNPDTNNDGG